MSKYVSTTGGPVKPHSPRKLSYLIETIANVVLETPPIMFQSCPPSAFVLCPDNARRVLAALEREGFVVSARV